MTTPRLILYIVSMIVAVALIFGGVLQLRFMNLNEGLPKIGLGLTLVLLNSSRVDRA